MDLVYASHHTSCVDLFRANERVPHTWMESGHRIFCQRGSASNRKRSYVMIHSLISAIGQIIVPYAWRRLPASSNLVEWPLNKLLRYCRVGTTTIIIVVANLLLLKQRRRLVRRCDVSRRSSNSSILRRSNWGVTVIQWNNSRKRKHQSRSSRWIPNIHKSNSPAYA
jgi:hypothetical protein